MCDVRDPEPRAPGADLRWYRRVDDQCAPCTGDAKLWFGILVGLFACIVPLGVLASRLLLNLSSLPYVSPVLAFVSFAQFVGEFKDFGNIWPLAVRNTLEFFGTLWTLNLESLNSECALGLVPFPTSFWGRQVFKLLFPLMVAHAYVLWMTLRDATLLAARLIVPRCSGLGPDNGAPPREVRSCRARWRRFAVRCAREAKAEAEVQRRAERELGEAREALQAGDAELAAARAPATPAGELLRGVPAPRRALTPPHMLSAPLVRRSRRAEAPRKAAHSRGGASAQPPFRLVAACDRLRRRAAAVRVLAALLHVTAADVPRGMPSACNPATIQDQPEPLPACLLPPQVPGRFQFGHKLPTTSTFAYVLTTLLLPCLCNHVLAVARLLRLLPRRRAAAVVLGLCAWTVLCAFLVFDNSLALGVKMVMLIATVLGSMALPFVLPPLLARRLPRSSATWGCTIFAVLMICGASPFLVGENSRYDWAKEQAWAPPEGETWEFAVAIWISMLVMCCIHSTLVFLRNFDDGALVRIYMMVLSLFYVPVSSATIFMFIPIISSGEWQGFSWVGGVIFLFLFPIGIPLLQYHTLKSIQTKTVTDIVTWPGKQEGTGQRDQSARARYGVLFLRFEIRLPDAEIPKLYGATGLIRWRSLAAGCNPTTLPFYWSVVETLRKLAVVTLCSLMDSDEQNTARCVILILIFSLWQLVVSRVRPYAANPLALIATSDGTQRTHWLHRAGSLDVNEIVRRWRSNGRFCKPAACTRGPPPLAGDLPLLHAGPLPRVRHHLHQRRVRLVGRARLRLVRRGRARAPRLRPRRRPAHAIPLGPRAAPPASSQGARDLRGLSLARAAHGRRPEQAARHAALCATAPPHTLCASADGVTGLPVTCRVAGHRHGLRAWYDMDEDTITIAGMRQGIAASRRYALFLSEGALSRAPA